MVKGEAAEGATRSTTEARGAGLVDVEKGGAAEGATGNNDKNWWKRPVITKEEEDPGKKGDTKRDKESKNKYQTALRLLHPKAGIGTNSGQAGNKTKAKYQTTLCLLHPKASIGTNYGR